MTLNDREKKQIKSYSITFSVGPRAKIERWNNNYSFLDNIGIYFRKWNYGYRFVFLWFAVIATTPEYDEILREVSGYNKYIKKQNPDNYFKIS